MSGKELTTVLTDALARLAPGRGITAAYLYGSHARGEARPGSDIDIAVLLEDRSGISALDLLKLGQQLENQTGLKNIDIRSLNAAPLSARGRIITEGKLLYSGNDIARVDFEVYTRSLYFDFLPHMKYLQKEFIRRTAEKGL
ncbi:MAG: nucleotidyltransferase domain-containing protein [Actinobacteria bacterium]|nr:nucleotidyltransferase domain-containing protein [Actinomycetota bacterium]